MNIWEILLLTSPVLISAVLLWCFGKFILHCPGRWKYLFMSLGIAAVSFSLFWMVFFVLNTLFVSFTIDVFGPALACLLFSWFMIREFYKCREGNRISVSTGFVLAFVYVFVQGVATVGFGVEMGVITLT